MIDILIADDHKIFRDGIKALLEQEADLKIIAEAENSTQVLDNIEQQAPDVILMDIDFGEGKTNGIETTRLVREKNEDIQILALSMHSEQSYIVKMLEAGASGYILKNTGRDELLAAIKTVAGGDSYYSREVSARLIQSLTKPQKPKKIQGGVPLTSRELEILKLIAQEYSNSEIAEKLFISIRTVDTHRRNLLEKLGVKNTVGLVKYALKIGLIED